MAANPYSLGHLSQVSHSLIQSRPDNLFKMAATTEAVVMAINLLPCLQFEFPAMLMHLACKKRGTLIFVQQATFSEVPSFFQHLYPL